MQLYTSPRTPFGRKVRIVLLEKGLAHDVVNVELARRDDGWFRDNPIGKIPVLVVGGVRIPDSTVICETLEDRYPEPPLYERDRLRCRLIEELADTLGDRVVEAFFARQRGDAATADRAEVVIERLLAALDARVQGDWPPGFTLADAATVGALGYLELRLGPAWRPRHPALARLFDRHAERPSVAATVPSLG